MEKTSAIAVRYSEHPVWLALSRYVIGPVDARLSFSARLARENGWSVDHAERVLCEYRRFCYLAATEPEPVTPSDAVDQAWHLHLTYTRDYWNRFCPDVLGLALHHGPTAGGAAEQARFHEQYAHTLYRYEHVFGEAPSPAIWPGAARRLLDDPRARRVHPRDGIVVPRALAWIVPAVTAVLAALVLNLMLKGA